MTPELRKNIEQMTLSAVLGGLIVACALIFVNYGRFWDAFEKNPNKRYPDLEADYKPWSYKPWNPGQFQPLLDKIKSPPEWKRSESPVFNARLIKYDPETQKVEFVDPKKQLYGGAPKEWWDKYNISVEDTTSIANGDIDKDGFTNNEEYRWEESHPGKESSPIDANQHPDWATKLEYKKYDKQDSSLLFKAYTETGEDVTFQINYSDQKKRLKTEFLKKGESFKAFDGEYIIVEFQKKIIEKFDPAVDGKVIKDLSELVVKRADGTQMTLIHERKQVASIITAEFAFPLDKQLFRAKIGEEFLLKGSKYKVIDIQEKTVKIQELSNNEEFTINITE